MEKCHFIIIYSFRLLQGNFDIEIKSSPNFMDEINLSCNGQSVPTMMDNGW